ncbi:hypothetical protein PspLS_07319, partial [Pyricularia sp. CBS 133598]
EPTGVPRVRPSTLRGVPGLNVTVGRGRQPRRPRHIATIRLACTTGSSSFDKSHDGTVKKTPPIEWMDGAMLRTTATTPPKAGRKARACAFYYKGM